MNKPLQYRLENLLHLAPRAQGSEDAAKNFEKFCFVGENSKCWQFLVARILKYQNVYSYTWPSIFPSSFQEIFNGKDFWSSCKLGFGCIRETYKERYQYVEVYESPGKKLERVFRRVRGRLNLEVKSIVAIYFEKPNKLCKHLKSFWMKKE